MLIFLILFLFTSTAQAQEQMYIYKPLKVTASSGIGSLAFFNSKLGVAVTCGVLFAIVCFIALFVVISLNKNEKKSDKKQNKNEEKLTAQSLIEAFNPKDLALKLTNKDIERIANGLYERDKSLFKFEKPR